MHRIKLKYNNARSLRLLMLGLFLLFITTIIMPYWFSKYLTFSGIGSFFRNNIIYSVISMIILMYFILINKYYYKIQIDSYIIQIKSYRLLYIFFKKEDYVDIPHNMLIDYFFINKFFSINRMLVLKIRTDKGKIINKSFNLTLIPKKQIRRIEIGLKNIIEKNN